MMFLNPEEVDIEDEVDVDESEPSSNQRSN